MDDDMEQMEDLSEEEMENEDFENTVIYSRQRSRHLSDIDLPSTVELLNASNGCKVYLVGTAHFSESSQKDVAMMIQQTQPDVVMVELCPSRINILSLDEATLLREAKNINLDKIRAAIRQSGVIQGVLHLLLLSMSAHITEQLGMAPGGEFRTAFRESKNVPGCKVHLGDRPIAITLQRALGSLSWFQYLRLAWCMLNSNEAISQEDVEKCKNRDLLEELLVEMTGEFPGLSQVFVTERDIYLAHSLKLATELSIPDLHSNSVRKPEVVVGVVGIGHVPGIVANWEKNNDISSLMIIPKPSMFGRCFKLLIRVSAAGVFTWGCYRVCKFSYTLLVPAR